MSTFRLFLSFLLSLSTRLSIALPTSSSAFSPLTPRTLYCANAPTVQAGSLFSRALPLPHPPSKRNPAYPYCAQNTRTYIVGTLFAPYLPWTSPASVAVADLLIDAEKFVTHHLQTEGDGLLAGGRFDWPGGHNLMLRAWNANNHQLTYGVLAAGLQALQVWAWRWGWGLLMFNVFDGENWVGRGWVEYADQPLGGWLLDGGEVGGV